MFRAPCAHRQEVRIVLYSLWYYHTYRWPSRAQVEIGLHSSLTFLKLGGEWFTSRSGLFAPGKELQYPLRPTVFQDFCKREKTLSPTGILTPDHPTRSLVATPATLPLLNLRGGYNLIVMYRHVIHLLLLSSMRKYSMKISMFC